MNEERLAEQPKWRLTQILMELEQAGLPGPIKINFDIQSMTPYSISFESKDEKGIEMWSFNFYGKFTITTFWGKDLYSDLSFSEAIEKLKELLK